MSRFYQLFYVWSKINLFYFEFICHKMDPLMKEKIIMKELKLDELLKKFNLKKGFISVGNLHIIL